MSPFSIFLRNARLRRGLRQNQLAAQLGYEQSYISALERSQKGPPRKDFIDRLIRGLELNDEERYELEMSLERSRRQVSLPCAASIEEYELIHELEPMLGRLNAAQIQIIRQVLTFTRLGFEGSDQLSNHPSIEEVQMP